MNNLDTKTHFDIPGNVLSSDNTNRQQTDNPSSLWEEQGTSYRMHSFFELSELFCLIRLLTSQNENRLGTV